MIKDFVTFLFPGAFLSEDARYEISSWDVEEALIRYNTFKQKPFAFYFTRMERKETDWTPQEIAKSGKYYINGTVKSLEDVKAENNPRNSILIDNMRINKWDRIIVTPYGNCQPLLNCDLVIEC